MTHDVAPLKRVRFKPAEQNWRFPQQSKLVNDLCEALLHSHSIRMEDLTSPAVHCSCVFPKPLLQLAWERSRSSMPTTARHSQAGSQGSSRLSPAGMAHSQASRRLTAPQSRPRPQRSPTCSKRFAPDPQKTSTPRYSLPHSTPSTRGTIPSPTAPTFHLNSPRRLAPMTFQGRAYHPP